MNLQQTQNEFSLNLLSSELEPQLAISGPVDPKQLLQLYRNNFVVSLTEMLEAVFPVCEQLVGEEFFKQLSKAYIVSCPLTEASLENYGEGFAAFIEQSPQTESVPFLAPMAQLEWNLEQAKGWTEITSFPYQSLMELEPEQQNQLCLHIAKGVRVQQSAFPVLSIWHGVNSGNLDGIDMTAGEALLLVPQMGDGAELILLTDAEQQLFSAFKSKQPLHELQLPEHFEELLKVWIATGIIDDFSLAEEE
jgi:hypothetical protein